MNKNNDKKLTLSQWLLKYRKLIMLIAFFVIVPVVAVTSFYVSTFNRYRNVEFSTGVQRNFQTMSVVKNEDDYNVFQYETDQIIVTITLLDMEIPQYEVDDTGFYEFNIKWALKSGQTAPKSAVQLEIVLQADWMNARSTRRYVDFPTATKSQDVKIDFNYKLGSPLWFVNVKRPNIFVLTKYEKATSIPSNTISAQFFHMANLTKIEPVPQED